MEISYRIRNNKHILHIDCNTTDESNTIKKAGREGDKGKFEIFHLRGYRHLSLILVKEI